MSQQVKSNNSNSTPLVRDFFDVSGVRFFLDLSISVILLVVFNAKAIWDYLNNVVLINQEGSLTEVLSQNVSWFDRFVNRLGATRIPQIVLWVLMGCIFYILLWLMKNFVTNIRNDVIASQYVTTQPVDGAQYWTAIMLKKIFFVVSLFATIVFMIVSIKLVAILADLCHWAIISFSGLHIILEIVGAVAVVMFLLQVMIILTRVTARSWWSITNQL